MLDQGHWWRYANLESISGSASSSGTTNQSGEQKRSPSRVLVYSSFRFALQMVWRGFSDHLMPWSRIEPGSIQSLEKLGHLPFLKLVPFPFTTNTWALLFQLPRIAMKSNHFSGPPKKSYQICPKLSISLLPD